MAVAETTSPVERPPQPATERAWTQGTLVPSHSCTHVLLRQRHLRSFGGTCFGCVNGVIEPYSSRVVPHPLHHICVKIQICSAILGRVPRSLPGLGSLTVYPWVPHGCVLYVPWHKQGPEALPQSEGSQKLRTTTQS